MYFKSEPGREQLGSYYQLKINYLGLVLYSVFFFYCMCTNRIVFYGELHDFPRNKKRNLRSIINYICRTAAVILLDRE